MLLQFEFFVYTPTSMFAYEGAGVYIAYMIEGSLEVKTSHNMDRFQKRSGKSQRTEEKKKEDQRRERVRSKKMQAREKVGKSRNTVFFQ